MKIGIIGCGNMGSAFATRLTSANELLLYDNCIEKPKNLASQGIGRVCENILDLLEASWIILAIKPQHLLEVTHSMKNHIKKSHTIFSLLAGTSIDCLSKHFPNSSIIRLMPNLPVICGQGAIGVSTLHNINPDVKDKIYEAFQSLGTLYWICEEKMHAVTSLGGSGPAFIYTIIEAIIDAGIAMGFSAEESLRITYDMMEGSLALLKKLQVHPGELKWKIASPKGTTIAGICKLEESSLRASIINTFLASYKRSKDLSNPLLFKRKKS